jgi:uncharacterized protein
VTHYVYRLIPPRPSFAQDLSESEAARMGEHASYWQELLAGGDVVVYGPVDDPAGTWGLAVFEAHDEVAAHAIAEDDPAVRSGMCTFALHPMAVALTPDR